VAPSTGYQAAVLDTSWAARALSERAFASDMAAGWLAANQLPGGSWEAAPRSPLFVTATTLRGLRDLASKSPQAANAAAHAAAYLLTQRQGDGSWGGAVWMTALVYESLHDFITDPAISATVHDWLLTRQASDGSWDEDPYTTAIAVRALALTAAPPRNPTLSGLKVQLVDSETGASLAGVSLNLTGVSSQSAASDSNGVIQLSGIPAGAYNGGLAMTGYTNLVISATLAPDQVTDLGKLQMSRVTGASSTSAVVSGLLVDGSNGHPLASATVALSGTSLQALSDSQGKYLISGVPAGSYTITASKAGYASSAAALTVVAGTEYVFSPALPPASSGTGTDAQGCRVFGTVSRASDGAAITGAGISLGGANSASIATDATGAYLITGLTSGATTISVVATGYDSVNSTVSLACNSNAAANFSPRLYASGTSPSGVNTASVSFTVVDAGTDAALAGITVTATPQGQSAHTLVTGSDGRFTVDKLQQVALQIDINTSGFDPISLSYQVVPLQATDMGQLRLRRTGTDALLPDLKVMTVHRASAVTDPQTLTLSGAIQVDISNAGRANVPQPVQVVAFYDVNRDGHYDPAVDQALGQVSLDQLLAVAQSTTLTIPVSGTLPFRDAPIHVSLDSNQQLAEINKANNIKSTADAAEIQPSVGSFNPVLKWKWDGSASQYPDYNQVMMAPVVGRLVDTNGDGKIDATDTPVVAFMSFYKGGYTISDGVLRVVDGVTGKDLLTIRDAQYPLSTDCSLALADLDGDGRPEIIAITKDYRIIVYRNDGTRWWVSAPVESNNGSSPWGGVYVADIDGDGHPEIVWGRGVYAFDGTPKWRASGSFYGTSLPGYQTFSLPVAADLFGQGQQNVIIGASVYSPTGQLLWAVQDGFTAVGDFTGDGIPEIAVVYNGSLSLFKNTGQLLWRVPLPGGGSGGPPTIADVDGDGVPEIGVAGGAAYTVFRKDGSVLWSKSSQDYSSNVTGSTVFDFDGDGSAEVLYGDEISIRAFMGATGQILWSIPNSSGTTLEYPLVVDLDGDGHADLVTIANNYANQPNQTVHLQGIRVFQDQNNTWVNVRQLWNQHAYNISNVNDDLTIPAKPQASWQVHNTYRANKRLDVSPTAVADATASYLRVADRAGASPSSITVRVGNGGALGTPIGLKVAFYAGTPGSSPLLGVGMTSRALGSGEYEDVSITIAGSLSAYPGLTVVADDDGTGRHAITDFDRSNNSVQGDLTQLATSLTLGVATDKPAYTELDTALFTAQVGNTGSFAKATQVRFSVLAADGSLVAVLPLQSPIDVAAGVGQAVPASWSTAGVLAGGYLVQAELLTSGGLVYASATAGFTIGSSNAAAVGAKLTLDKVRYGAADLVQVRSRVLNATANVLIENLTATTTIIGASGAVWTKVESVTQLASQGLREFGYSLPAGGFVPGFYTAQLVVTDGSGGQQASSSASFTVLGTDQTGIGLRASLQLPTDPVTLGASVPLAFTASNVGNTALTNVPLKLRIVDPNGGQLLSEFSFTTSLALNSSYSSAAQWTASGTPRTVVAVLVGVVGGREIALAQGTMNLIDTPVRLALSTGISHEARLLVLVSCSPGMDTGSPEDSACTAARAQWMSSFLVAQGVQSHISTTVDDFVAELHCGRYNSYWLSGGSDKLGATVAKEVREAVRRGAGMLVDGVHDQRNGLLDEVAGINYRGKLPQAGYQVQLDGPIFASSTLTSGGSALKLDLTTGAAQAVYPAASGIPAIVANGFGLGHEVLFGFDLVASLQADSAWTAAFRSALAFVKPAPAVAYSGGAWVPLTLTLTNQGQAATVVVSAHLPTGVSLDGTPAGATLDSSGSPVWQFALGVNETRSLLMPVRVTYGSGAFDVPFQVSTLRNGVTSEYGSVTDSFTVRAADVVGSGLVTALQQLSPTTPPQRNARDRAVSQVQAGLTLLSQARPADALVNFIGAADDLESVTSVTTTSVALDLADLVAEAEAHQCNSLPLCATSAPRAVNDGYFTPFGAAQGLEAHGGGAPGDWQWGLGADTATAGSFASGKMTWVSGKQYGWTLSYDVSGNGTLSVQDGTSTVLTTSFSATSSARLRVGNALQIGVRATADAGLAKVDASVRLLQGQAVSGAESTLGDGNYSESQLTYLLPSTPAGVRASGTVRLTFPDSTPPAGASLLLTVKAGNTACRPQ
jgi:hypothetical protein